MKDLVSIGVILLLAAACGGNSSPAAPSAPPPPVANIEFGTRGDFESCFGGTCFFQSDGRNNGPDCASAVRGVVRFFNSADVQVGASHAWALPGAQIVRANESFVYRTTSLVPFDSAATKFRSEGSWDAVRC